MSRPLHVVFAIPGDIEALTGGYGYDRALMGAMREAGVEVTHLRLGDTFPDPSEADLRHAAEALAAIPRTAVALVDGLAFAVLPTEILSACPAPLVALVHHPLADETGLEAERAAALRRAETAALAHAGAVVTTSATTAATLAGRFGVAAEAITVAPPGLDPAWRQDNRPAGLPQVVSVASLIPRKGFPVLIEALASLGDLAFTAHIIGSHARDPVHARALVHLTRRLDLAERIVFDGELAAEAIRARYAQASVFALPSRHEGFGMVFAEAMASGLPIVACRAGAVPEVVPPQAGILVDVDDTHALARALRVLLTDRDTRERFSRGAHAAAAQFYDWPQTARAALAALQSATARRARD